MSTYAATYSPNAYRSSAVLTASPGQLVVMLYDGARRFLNQAAVAMGERDIPAAHNKLTRAEDIIRHLRNTLDMEQGEIAARLQSIYTFSLASAPGAPRPGSRQGFRDRRHPGQAARVLGGHRRPADR